MKQSVRDIIESHTPQEVTDTLHELENKATELRALGIPVPHPHLHDISLYKKAHHHLKGTP